MKNTDRHIKLNKALYPLAYIYGAGVFLRNKCFDWKIMKSISYPIPLICLGNITVGGTGKTPHTEYLISLLQDKFNMAVVSRGYKRKTKGFRLADEKSTPREIGDEPFQIKHKYPKTTVAVDGDRRRAISKLLELTEPRVDVILLDDAFQHRYVKPGLSILLTDYNRLICQDKLMPVGCLREPESGRYRANIVMVTKCPRDIKPIDYNIITKELKLYPFQKIYFSTFKYGSLYSVFERDKPLLKLIELAELDNLLVLTGIANPLYLHEEIGLYRSDFKELVYKDHHDFAKKDIEFIEETFNKLDGENKIIVTTEKDAMRLLAMDSISETLKKALYVIPVEIEILQDKELEFNQNILDYVREDQRNS